MWGDALTRLKESLGMRHEIISFFSWQLQTKEPFSHLVCVSHTCIKIGRQTFVLLPWSYYLHVPVHSHPASLNHLIAFRETKGRKMHIYYFSFSLIPFFFFFFFFISGAARLLGHYSIYFNSEEIYLAGGWEGRRWGWGLKEEQRPC